MDHIVWYRKNTELTQGKKTSYFYLEAQIEQKYEILVLIFIWSKIKIKFWL